MCGSLWYLPWAFGLGIPFGFVACYLAYRLFVLRGIITMVAVVLISMMVLYAKASQDHCILQR